MVLTKADLTSDPAASQAAVESVALGVEVLTMNALEVKALGALRHRVSPDRTAVLIGASGAGKSTIINGLLGEKRHATQEVRLSDGRGRHTTVVRELVLIPGGGCSSTRPVFAPSD